MQRLVISHNRRYLMQEDKPFFWLGDTAWLLFGNVSEEEAYVYLKNRAEKGFNVIQAVLVYATEELNTVNVMPYHPQAPIESEEYWKHVDRVISMAEDLGLYMALLPCWGSLVKTGVLHEGNVLKYAQFLCERYHDRTNLIWVLGGDIRADEFTELYRNFGRYLKEHMPDTLVSYHPFGRTASTTWFAGEDWMDFHMFQSGHRRYDQCSLGVWDDAGADMNTDYYGEDNWRYVEWDYRLDVKPTLDAEPSYEWIPQGLHDVTQPYWTAYEVRRYAYWSVLAGACGHTYGDNAVMQFYREGNDGVTYGPVCEWDEAIHHAGSGQMKILKDLVLSLMPHYMDGTPRDELLVGGQRPGHARIALFGGEDFLIAYDFLGEEWAVKTDAYEGCELYWLNPATGVYSYAGICPKGEFHAHRWTRHEGWDADRVLLIRRKVRE